MSRWTVEPGRNIHFDGQPFVHIDRESEALPVEADELTKFVVDQLNSTGATPDELYKKRMGVLPRQSQRKHTAREAHRSDDRPISMTYGELPPFKKFERDIRRPNPDNTDRHAYWPAGTLFPMELVSNHEIELAETFGLGEFEAERQITGRNTRVRGFKDNERAIYEFIEFLTDRWNNGDEEAGDLASSIMMTLGYEWI